MLSSTLSVVFVCTGNICRSPSAEGVLSGKATAAGLGERLLVDSAGTHGYHIGEPPDARAIQAAAARGYDIAGQRARAIGPTDFDRFDLILGLDRGHLRLLTQAAPAAGQDRVGLLMDYAPRLGTRDVPDPYYGDIADFERALDLIEAAVDGLIEALRLRLERM